MARASPSTILRRPRWAEVGPRGRRARLGREGLNSTQARGRTMDRWRATAAPRAPATAGLFAMLALGSCDPAPEADMSALQNVM